MLGGLVARPAWPSSRRERGRRVASTSAAGSSRRGRRHRHRAAADRAVGAGGVPAPSRRAVGAQRLRRRGRALRHAPRTAPRLGAYPVEGADGDRLGGHGRRARHRTATGDFLYVGDIGDNDAVRPSVTVYRVPEPDEAPGGARRAARRVRGDRAHVPGRPVRRRGAARRSAHRRPRHRDEEPARGVAGARAPTPPRWWPGAPVDDDRRRRAAQSRCRRRRAAGCPGTAVTGGDVSPDGSLVVLRTYRSVLVFERADDQTLAEALLGEPCFGPQEEEPQGEAIAFTGDGAAYVTASEGANVADPPGRAGRAGRDDDHRPTTTTDGRAVGRGRVDDDVDDRGRPRRRRRRAPRRSAAARCAWSRRRRGVRRRVARSGRAAGPPRARTPRARTGPRRPTTAASSGSTTLPGSVSSHTTACGDVVDAEGAHREVHVVEHRRGDRAGGHDVHGDAVALDLLGQRAGEHVEAGLRRRVGALARLRGVRGARREEHHPPAGRHHRQRGVGHHERRREVGAHHRLERLERLLAHERARP